MDALASDDAAQRARAKENAARVTRTTEELVFALSRRVPNVHLAEQLVSASPGTEVQPTFAPDHISPQVPGVTAFFLMARSGSATLIQAAAAAGGRLDWAGDNGPPVFGAMQSRHVGALHALLQLEAAAAASGTLRAGDADLSAGAGAGAVAVTDTTPSAMLPARYRYPVTTRADPVTGRTVLHHAFRHVILPVDMALFRVLDDAGVPGTVINTRDRDGRTPIHIALAYARGVAALWCAQRGATVHEPADRWGLTPLHYLAFHPQRHANVPQYSHLYNDPTCCEQAWVQSFFPLPATLVAACLTSAAWGRRRVVVTAVALADSEAGWCMCSACCGAA